MLIERYGRKYRFPDTATEEQIDRYTAKDQARRREAEENVDIVKGLPLAAMQGLTFSFGDEAIARVRSMLGEDYDEALKATRDGLHQFYDKYPVASFFGEVAGAAPLALAAPYIAAPLRAAAVASKLPQAAGALSKLPGAQTIGKVAANPYVKNTAIGSGVGGVSGIGAAESDDEILPSAGKGILVGGGLGAAIPVVQKGARGAYDWLADRLWPSLTDVVGRGRSAVTRALSRDNVTLDELKRRMTADSKMGVPSRLADASPAATDLAETVGSYPGAETTKLGRDLMARNEDQRQRVAGQLNWRLGRKDHQAADFYDTADELTKTLKANAKDSYKAAYDAAQSVKETPALTEALNNPAAEGAWRHAIELAGIEGRKIGPIDATGRLKGLSLETLDDFKRGLDAAIEAETDRLTRQMTSKGRALVQYKNRFVDSVEGALPEGALNMYRTARKTYRGDKEMIDAIHFGKDEAWKTAPELLERKMAGMSQGEREMVQQGFLRRMDDMLLEPSANFDAAKRIVNSPRTMQRLDVLFENKGSLDLLKAALERERELWRNAAQVTGNSRTQRRLLGQKDFEGQETGLIDILAPDVGAVGVTSHGGIYARVTDYLRNKLPLPEKKAQETARILRAGTPDEVKAALADLEAQAAKTERDIARSEKIGRGAAVAAGSVAGDVPETEVQEFSEGGQARFDPEGSGYDYESAVAAGHAPNEAGHWGSVAEQPDGTYLMLKGRKHETWDKGVTAEEREGRTVVKRGGRYFAVPQERGFAEGGLVDDDFANSVMVRDVTPRRYAKGGHVEASKGEKIDPLRLRLLALRQRRG